MKRAVVYLRPGLDSQCTLDDQTYACMMWCHTHGYRIIRQFQDFEGGQTLNRAGMRQMIQGMLRHWFDVVVCYDPSRIASRGNALSAFIQVAEHTNVVIDCIRYPEFAEAIPWLNTAVTGAPVPTTGLSSGTLGTRAPVSRSIR